MGIFIDQYNYKKNVVTQNLIETIRTVLFNSLYKKVNKKTILSLSDSDIKKIAEKAQHTVSHTLTSLSVNVKLLSIDYKKPDAIFLTVPNSAFHEIDKSWSFIVNYKISNDDRFVDVETVTITIPCEDVLSNKRSSQKKELIVQQ